MASANVRMFFTAKPVINAVGRARRRVLSKAGAFIHRRARSSIRKRRRSARPGEPPSSHVGLLKRFLYFAYDFGTQSVVIGPARLGGRRPYGNVTVPEVLEEGGNVTAAGHGKRRRRRYAPHPYMGPAYAAERPNLARHWADEVRS